MKLKRVASKANAGKAKKGEAFISRFAGGLCFDFSAKDLNMWVHCNLEFPSQVRVEWHFAYISCWCSILNFLCVVFSYLAGTEEGHIHRCSCSYNEQYLDSYVGHAVSWVERTYKMTHVVSLILLSIIVLCDYMNSWIHDLINVFYVIFLWLAGSCVFDSLVPIYTRCVPEL